MTSSTKNQEPGTRNQKQKACRFLFLNQFVPPDPAPTARLLGDVALELEARGHEVILVGDRAGYRGEKTLLGSRALREGLSLLRLLVKTMTSPRADAIVCLTSPPMLPVVAWMARRRHGRAKLIHWAMDLYPDVAVALGEVREGSTLHRVTRSLMERVYRACDLVVVLDREMAARVGPDPLRCEIVPPWPPEVGSVHSQTEVPSADFTWLYSGNLGRAHEWRTLLEAQSLLGRDGAEVNLVFQGGGAERQAAQGLADELGLKRCFWRDYAPEDTLVSSLLAADALVVTQRPGTAGCLWPSKLALALTVDRPVLWIGATNGGVAEVVSEAGHSSFAPGEATALAQRLRELAEARAEEVPSLDPALLTARLADARRRGISGVAGLFEEAVARIS